MNKKAMLLTFMVTAVLFGAFTLFASMPAPKAETAIDSSTLSAPQLIESYRELGHIDSSTANLYLAYALFSPEKLPQKYHGNQAWYGTMPLLELRQNLAGMTAGPVKNEIEALLAVSTCDRSSNTPTGVFTSTHFLIEYYPPLPAPLTINDYADALESSWSTQVDSYGWAAPLTLHPGGLYHVIIDDLDTLYPEFGKLYGLVDTFGTYAGPVAGGDNPNTTWSDGDALASCMLINNDLSGLPSAPLESLQATAAHELIHSIQFGYGVLDGSMDSLFVEGLATLMEDEVFDAVDDNQNFGWPNINSCLGEYQGTPPYNSWYIFRAMGEQSGTNIAGGNEDVWQEFHELMSQNSALNLTALDQAFTAIQGNSLANVYHDAAITLRFSKTCGGFYLYPHCFEEGSSYRAKAGTPLPHTTLGTTEGSVSGMLQNHYASTWIDLPNSGTYNITLENSSPGTGALKGSIVCDTGTTLSIFPFSENVTPANPISSIVGFDASACTAVSVVLSNVEQTAANPLSCTAATYKVTTSTTPPPPTRGDYLDMLPLVMQDNVATPFPTPTSTPIPSQLLNGDFEAGAVDWIESSDGGWSIVVPGTSLPDVPTHGGDWAAWLGGDNSEQSSLFQNITVSTAEPYLRFWYWSASEDACGYDFFTVWVDNVKMDEIDLCVDKNSNKWVERILNLTLYGNQTVKLEFRVTTDASFNSNLFLDDVSLSNSNTIQPVDSTETIIFNSRMSKSERWKR